MELIQTEDINVCFFTPRTLKNWAHSKRLSKRVVEMFETLANVELKLKAWAHICNVYSVTS
jgi:hypothetical protein